MSVERSGQRPGGPMGGGPWVDGPMGAMGRPVEKAKDFKGTFKQIFSAIYSRIRCRLTVVIVSRNHQHDLHHRGPKDHRTGHNETVGGRNRKISRICHAPGRTRDRFWLYRTNITDPFRTLSTQFGLQLYSTIHHGRSGAKDRLSAA